MNYIVKYIAHTHCIVLCTECRSEKRVTENTEGTLYYPGFDQYGNNVRCQWTFLAPDGYVYIILFFTYVYILQNTLVCRQQSVGCTGV